MEAHVSRRRLLRAAGGSLAAAGTAGLAGCTSNFLGAEDHGGELTAWLVDPAVAYDDVFTRSFEFVTPPVVFDHDDELSYSRLESSAELREQIGVPATELDWTLEQSGTVRATVVGGSFAVDEVGGDLSDWAEGRDVTPEEHGEYEGFELYRLGERNECVAVRDDHVISASPHGFDDDPVDVAEAVIEGRFDGVNRWTDDGDADALLGALPEGHFASGSIRAGPVEDEDVSDVPDWEVGLLGEARVLSVDGDSTDVTAVYLYDSSDDADADEVATYVDEQRDVGGEFATLQDYDVAVDGRIVTVAGTARTNATF